MADFNSYQKLTKELQERIIEDREKNIKNPYACKDEAIIRRFPKRDVASLWRPAFARDIDKIMNVPYYSRYADKTQVFSFVKNDDITRRWYHVQLVAKIAKNIGSLLGLNLDLIEAAALGHDIGHTPFGHEGERLLSQKYQEHTGRYFNHNVHSVRVLDQLVQWNISLQTLDAVLCHNGELELKEYCPKSGHTFDFAYLENEVEQCTADKKHIDTLIPSTLEGCVVRVSDIIAYLGKDRQDAERLNVIEEDAQFSSPKMGTSNPFIINNMIVNIVENSYGQPYLKMDEELFEEFRAAKSANYEFIYRHDTMRDAFTTQVTPMFDAVYEELLKQVKSMDKNSIFYKHHVEYLEKINRSSPSFSLEEYLSSDPNVLVVDYIASMTDDYFIDLYRELFPKGAYDIRYQGYFDVDETKE